MVLYFSWWFSFLFFFFLLSQEKFADNTANCELFDDPQGGIFTFLDRATGDEMDPESSDKVRLLRGVFWRSVQHHSSCQKLCITH